MLERALILCACAITHMGLGIWSYHNTSAFAKLESTSMYEMAMVTLYCLTIDAFWTIFQLNISALRNYHWKFHYNLFVICCCFLFVADMTVRTLCLTAHALVMYSVYRKLRRTVASRQGIDKFSGKNEPDYLDCSLRRNWHYILLSFTQVTLNVTGMVFMLTPVIGTVGGYLINLHEGRRQTKLAHFVGTTFHAGTSTGMLVRQFAAPAPYATGHFSSSLQMDMAAVCGYVVFTFTFSYLNGGALWKSHQIMNHRWRSLTHALLPVLSWACGDYRHEVLVFMGACGPAMLVLYLNSDLPVFARWSLSETAQSMKQAWRSWIVGSCIMLLPVACTLAVKIDGDGSLSMVSGMQWTRAMFSLPALCCMLPIVVGYVWMTTFSHLDTYDQMCCIWLLLNAFWFHLGCDVLSGLFGIMPNLAEAYLVADRRHNTERRVEMDAMYWCELFIHSPLCALVFWSYCTRQPHTKLLEAIVQAISFTGTIAYYGPEMLSGWPNTVVAPARYAWLGLGAVWIVVPFIIMLQTCKGITSTGVLTEPPPQTTAASRVFTGAQTVTTIELKQTKDASSATKAHDIGTFSKALFGLVWSCLVACLATSALLGYPPTWVCDFMLAHRIFQAIGHIMHALGRGNEFTKTSGLNGMGLLADSSGFLIEGIVHKHPPSLGWGVAHLLHLPIGAFTGRFPDIETYVKKTIVQRLSLYSITVSIDVVFNLISLQHQFELQAQRREGTPVQVALLVVLAAVSWALLNTDSAVLRQDAVKASPGAAHRAMEPSMILSGVGLIMFWLWPQIVPVASLPVPPPPPPQQWWAKAGAFFCK